MIPERAGMNGWMELMRRRDFEAAWTLSDSWLGVPQDHCPTPRHLQRIWEGRSLRGKRVLRPL